MWVNPKYFFVGTKAVRYPLTAGKKKKKRNKFPPDPQITRRKVCFTVSFTGAIPSNF